ncbi:FeoA family protein [Treponema endosymbiont of Eucomonympha sp.]|uniref:FeoA family protein n=2 Tax=Treponema endosymbiont of Eucomonympha sp. TaxID=1580831 RepID=UPI000750AABC|nr:FeoA family protein [Treponema endosymbiont of Eucomonympha sp.]
MPLTFVKQGEFTVIKKIGGQDSVRQHLANMGFVVGVNVRVVSEFGGNMIVCVKDSRVAISREMASKIQV